MATFGNYVQSVTRHKIVPSVVEGIVNGNVLLMRTLTNSKEWSGESLKRPLMYAKNTSGGSYSGFDTFSTAQVDTRVLMAFDPRQNYQSVVLSNLDLAVNATQERVLDLLKVEMETAQVSMLDRLGDQIYGDGTGNSNKDFLGLNTMVDDGTVTSTYGNLTRASYPTPLNSSVTASVGAITRARMATAFDAATHGHQEPTLIITDKTTWSYIESLYASTIRTNYTEAAYTYVTKDRYNTTKDKATLRGEVGFKALNFRGTPIVADEKCTSGYIYFLNENYLEWYGLKHPQHEAITLTTSTMDSGAYNEAPKVKGFAWTGLKEPVNQDAEIGQILLYGNFICWSPRHQAVLKGITS